MTIKELIEKLKDYPDTMQVLISVPNVILDDGYVDSYRLCRVDGASLSDFRPVVFIDYDRCDYVEII